MTETMVFGASNWLRWSLRVLLVGAGLVVLGSCDPGPAPVDLVVSTTADGADADPGDGVCEVTSGAGDCSLRAAIDEINASPGAAASVTVPGGTYSLTLGGVDDTNAGGDLDVDHDASVVIAAAEGERFAVDGAGGDAALDVVSGTVSVTGADLGGAGTGVRARSGASVVMAEVQIGANSGAGLVLDDGASAVFGHGAVVGNGGAGVELAPGADAHVFHSTVGANGAGGVEADGSVRLSFVTVTANGAGGVAGAGGVLAESSVVADQVGGADCAAAVTSGGYNLDSDGTCGLGATGDVSATPAGLGPLAAAPTMGFEPLAGSPVIDAIPSGGVECPPGATDQRGVARPVGSGCDRGAVEADFGLDLVVNVAGDGSDVTPGDGVCEMTVGVGDCSLRAAVDEANTEAFTAAHTITLAADPVLTITAGVGENLNLTGDIDVSTNVSIIGEGHTISGGSIDRVIDHRAGSLAIDDTTIRDGDPTGSSSNDWGGGVRTYGTLTIDDSTIEDNANGGISVETGATLTLDRSTERANAVAGVHVLGNGTAAILHSTLTGHGGPGVLSTRRGVWARSSTTVDITASTLSENGADIEASGNAAVTVERSTLARSANAIDADQDAPSVTLTGSVLAPVAGASCLGPVVSGGWNLAVDSSCALTGPGDQVANPVLGPLADNGGPTATHLPHQGSPAVDAIPDATPGLCDGSTPTDQRGEPRPAGSGCDIGAVEGVGGPYEPALLVVDTHQDSPDALLGDGACETVDGFCSLRAALAEASLQPGADTVTVQPGLPTILIGASASALAVTGDLVVDGNGATIDANGTKRVIDHLFGALTISELTLTGGFAAGGAGIRTASDLDLVDVVIAGNRSFGAGGWGIALPFGPAAVQGGPTSSISIQDSELLGTPPGGGQTNWGTEVVATTGDLTIERTLIADNLLGGLQVSTTAVLVSGDGELTMRQSTIADSVDPTLPVPTDRALAVGPDARASVSNSTLSGSDIGVTGTGDIDLVASTVVADDVGVSGGPDVSLHGTAVYSAGAACGAPVTSLGWNVAPGTECGLAGPGDQPSTYPQLASLGDNGGPTSTHLPLMGSVLVDAIPVGTPGLCDVTAPTDQRGEPRPLGAACDVGAVEGESTVPPNPLSIVVDTAIDEPDLAVGDGVCESGSGGCTLRAAVEEANASFTPDTISLAPGLAPVELSIVEPDEGGTDLDVTDPLTIEGNDGTVDANQLGRVFEQHTGTLILRDLTLTGGRIPGDLHGGALNVHTAAELENVTVTGNLVDKAAGHGDGYGAGIHGEHFSTITVTDSTITGNAFLPGTNTYQQGTGIAARGTLVVERSLVADNGPAVVPESQVWVLGTATIRESTIASTGGTGIAAGGPTVIESSTITGQHTGIAGATGGATSPMLEIRYTTVHATTYSVLRDAPASRTTVAGSLFTRSCYLPLTSLGYNFDRGWNCGFTATGDRQLYDVPLGPLADNGGPTPTRLPALGNLVINRIPIGTPGLCDGTYPTDQRGVLRPFGAGCDVGAVEQ